MSTIVLATILTLACVMGAVDAGECPPWTKAPCDCEYCDGKDRDCVDILNRDPSVHSGLYTVCVDRQYTNVQVYCDMVTDGGGWTVFQRRVNGTTDFYLAWAEYAHGFGNKTAEFWLGNRLLHAITDCHGPCQLRFDLEDFENETRYATYQNFYIAEESDKFRLNVEKYSGDAGDSFSYASGHAFTTQDQDNDIYSGNCAEKFEGAWWYTACHNSNLNGPYLSGPHTTYADGINWNAWKGYYYSLKTTELKLRCSK